MTKCFSFGNKSVSIACLSYKGRALSLVVHGPSRRFPGRADVELVEVTAFGRVPLVPVAVICSLEMAGHCVRIDDDDTSRAPMTRSQTPEPQARHSRIFMSNSNCTVTIG